MKNLVVITILCFLTQFLLCQNQIRGCCELPGACFDGEEDECSGTWKKYWECDPETNQCEPAQGETIDVFNIAIYAFTTGFLGKSEINKRISVGKYDVLGDNIWNKTYGKKGLNEGRAIVSDESGDHVVVGSMANEVDFGTKAFTSYGETDVFVLKSDENGNEIWAKRAGGEEKDNANDVALDNDGNVYVVGSYDKRADFDGIPIINEGKYISGFVAKYDVDGIIQWVVPQLAIDSLAETRGIAIGPDGMIYITGVFLSTLSLDTFKIHSNESASLFIAKMEPSGDVVNVSQYDSELGYTVGSKLVVDLDTSVFVTGKKSNQSILLKYDSNLELVGEKDIQSKGGFFQLNGITTTGERGTVQLIGEFEGDVEIDGRSIQNLGQQDVFLGEFDANLNAIWINGEGGTDMDYGIGIHNNGTGYTSYVGCTYGIAILGGITQEGDRNPYYRRFEDASTTVENINAFIELKINPNPFSHYLNLEIELESNQQIEFEIIDLQGRSIYRKMHNLNNGANLININLEQELRKGMYLLSLRNILGEKIVKTITKM